MTLREKLEQLRGESSEWIGGFPPPRIDEDEWNALIDVALAADDIHNDEEGRTVTEPVADALARLDKVLDQ